MQYSTHVNTKKTPQTKPIPGKETIMVENSAGGFVFKIDKWTQLDRFLILGSEGGTYYAKEKKLTQENAKNVIECIKEDGKRAVKRIVEISIDGRAPKNSPAIFALALAATHGDQETKKEAYKAIPSVCRIGTHLFEFCQSIQDMRGWSRGLRKGVANWYLGKTPKDLAYQLIKYRQRNGWTHRDVLRLSHPKAKNQHTNCLLRHAVGKEIPGNKLDDTTLLTFHRAQQTDNKKELLGCIAFGLPREAVPTKWLKDPEVWFALLSKMPMTAMIRSLGAMGSCGLLKTNFDEATKLVVSKMNEEAIKKAKTHPLQVLLALKTYGSGNGFKGKLSWTPVGKITDQLNEAFYYSFKNVEPTNKAIMIGLDVSGSMGSDIMGTNLTAREATAALCMITARSEQDYGILAFSDVLMPLNITPKMSLEEVCKKTENLPFSGTNCALPILAATQNGVNVDAFIIYTDSETYGGGIHTKQALDQYRQKTGINAKLIVAGVTATDFSIADPTDKGMLDVVGFDSSIAETINNFIKE